MERLGTYSFASLPQCISGGSQLLDELLIVLFEQFYLVYNLDWEGKGYLLNVLYFERASNYTRDDKVSIA